MTVGSTPRRDVAADWLRVIAMVCVVVSHALQSYAPGAGSWPSDPRAQSMFVGAVLLFIHCVPMPAFFFLAGWLGGRSRARTSGRVFLQRRTARLAIPLLLGLVTVVPFSYGLMVFGQAYFAGAPFHAARDAAIGFFTEGHYFTSARLAHLWFLWYLLILFVGAGLLARVRVPQRIQDLARTFEGRWWGLLLLAGATFLAMTAMGSSRLAEPSGIVPNLPLLALYGLFFALGWLRRDGARLSAPAPTWRVVILAGLAVGGFALALVSTDALLSRASYAVMMAATFLALLALVSRTRRERRLVTSSANASYWIYWSHLPLAVGAPVLAFAIGLPWSAGAGLSALVALLLPYSLARALTNVGVRQEPTPDPGRRAEQVSRRSSDGLKTAGRHLAPEVRYG